MTAAHVTTSAPPTASATDGGGGPLLALEDVHAYYGHIHALKGVTLEVNRGEIVTLIGSNGAGKTTTLKAISGLLHPRAGTIHLGAQDITHVPAHVLVRQGIGHAPEGRRIFGRLTVLENLQMGAFTRQSGEIADGLDRVYTLFPRLKERIGQLGGTLSGGEQQMLAIGRALMSHPRVLLLDEPSLGLSPILVQQIFAIIKEINAQGTTVLLVEQNALQALNVANRGYVLQTGKVVLSGPAKELIADPTVQKAYLGG